MRLLYFIVKKIEDLVVMPSRMYRAYSRFINLPICIRKIRQRESEEVPTRVGFFVLSNATEIFWEPLYDLFSTDKRFDPYIVIVPYTYASKKYMDDTVSALKERISTSGRKVVIADEKTIHESICCKAFFDAGIVFHMDPYTWLCNPKSQMGYLTKSLIFYTPYSYCIVNRDNAFELRNLKYPYRIFPETRLHIDCHKKYGIKRGRNVSPFLGYMGVHKLLNETHSSYNWKITSPNMKKIIIAPHHVLGLGNILRLHEFYLRLAQRYQSQISFVFKPHPYLREDLRRYWTDEHIKSYYSQWDDMPNTRLEDGGYVGLLRTSDAMILDSGSFNAEYSLLYKPLFFVEKKPRRKFNDVGERLFDVQYRGSEEDEIVNFIEDVVLRNKDILYESRKRFVDTYLMPGNQNIAQNTYDYVLSLIGYKKGCCK